MIRNRSFVLVLGGALAGACGTDDHVPQTALTNVVEVSAGGEHACARLGDGRVACWGRNSFMELGWPTLADGPAMLDHAVIVPDVANAVRLAAGLRSTCAVRQGGDVLCWGDNRSGQLGRNSDQAGWSGTPHAVGVPMVNGARGITSFASAAYAAADADGYCALDAAGAAICWGALPPSTDGPGYWDRAPVPRTGVTDAAFVAVTDPSSGCAILANATVACWGFGTSDGQANASGLPHPSPVPIAVPDLANVELLAAGTLQQCAAVRGGDVVCWTRSPDPAQPPSAPTGAVAPLLRVRGVSDVISLAAAGFDFFAVTRAGRVLQWHDDGPRQESAPVGGIDDAVAVTAGDGFACALTRAGTVRCWGKGGLGQLGDGHGNADGYQTSQATTVLLGEPPTVRDAPAPLERDAGAADREPNDAGAADSL